jgi:hypothetical protein
MKTIFIIIFASIGFITSAQITLEGKVIDAITKISIPYVNIGIPSLGKGTVSDFNGDYQLQTNSKVDKITFSSIGYKSMNIEPEDLISKPIVELEQATYKINPVKIQALRFAEEEIRLGMKNKNRGHSIGFGSAQLGTEIASAIKVKKPTYIKSAHFVLNHVKGDSLLFRVNIYNYEDGKIGDKALLNNVYIKEKQKKGVISVDLSEYELILDHDVLLSLEWLRNFDELGNKEITFDTKKGKKIKGIFVKYSSIGTFEKLPYQKDLNPCFYFLGKQVR